MNARRSVVILDDSAGMRLFMARALELGGTPADAIRAFAAPPDALASMATAPPGLVLCDLTLAGAGSTPFLQTLLANPNLRDVTVIGMTPLSPERLGLVTRALAPQILRKPFTPETLLRAVDGAKAAPAADEACVADPARAVRHVIEAFAMVCVDAPAPAPPPAAAWLGVVRFGGAARGRLALAAPEEFLWAAAAHLLGYTPGAAAAVEVCVDVFRELVSIAGGHVAETLAAAPGDIALGLPETAPIDGAAWAALSALPTVVTVQAGGVPLLIHVTREA